MSKVRRKLDSSAKRILLILIGVTVIASLAVVSIAMLGKKKEREIQGAARMDRLVPTASNEKGVEPSPATVAKLNRVHVEEAEAAKVKGQSYIPEVYMGSPQEIREAIDSGELPERVTPSYEHYQQSNQRSNQSQQVSQDRALLDDGLLKQLDGILAQQNKPATSGSIKIAYEPNVQGSQNQAATGGSNSEERDPEVLITADTILSATLLTPIDTYKTRFTLAEIVGGPFNGAQLRGEVIPLTASGEVEDVGVKFTSMNHNGNYYRIDAIALNESTATDAMDGTVDKRIFSRFVMPIFAATFSGAGTYFTARGTPNESILRDSDLTADAIVVERERATKEDAKYQAYGDAIKKGSQIAERAIDREAARPQRIHLEANTPIGLIFNAPVTANK